MLLLQVASLVVGISLLTPRLVQAARRDVAFLGADPSAPSSKGNEFFLGFIGNTDNAPVATSTAALFVTTDESGAVPFTVEYFGTTQSYEAIKGSTLLVNLPVGKPEEGGASNDIRIGSEMQRNKGVRVKATDDTKRLTIYGINDADVSTDAFLALPCPRYPITMYRYFVFSTRTESTTGTFESRFLIVACEDNTEVVIRPSQQIQVQPDLTTSPVPQLIDRGGVVNIIIQRARDTTLFQSPLDLTGTIIESNKPISVFVGHECGQVPSSRTACDHLVEQIPPDATWGTQFFTVPLDVRESGERYRVGTVTDNNQVNVTCTLEGQTTPRLRMTETIQASNIMQRYLEFDTIGDTTDGTTPGYRRDFCCIETSNPAIVMMYSKGHSVDEIVLPDITGTQGDPFMLLVPPISQYSNDYTATTAKQVRTDFIGHIGIAFSSQFFDDSAVSQNAVTVNGTVFKPESGYYPIYCSNNEICGYGAYSGIPVGSHEVRYNISGAAMNLFVYGFLREISFAYPAGFEMQPIGVPRISIFNITVLESVGTVRIPINRTGGDLSLRSVVFATSRDVPNQAVAGVDYVAQTRTRIRWLTGRVDPRYVPTPTARDPVFEFTILDDEIPEPPGREYFEIMLVLTTNIGTNNGFFYPNAVGRVTIIDDDIPPQIGFDPISYSYNENVGVARLTVTTNMPTRFTDATGALFYTENGTANGGGVDFTGYTRDMAIPIIFRDGRTETTIDVPITNDRLVEGTERFFGRIISGGGISNINIFAPNATVDIEDNDRLIFGFEQPSYTFSESVGNGNLGVRLSPESGQLSENLVFTFSTADGMDANAAVAPGDYTSASQQYTFMPGLTRLDIPVTIIDDSGFEGVEMFLGMLSMASSTTAIIDVPTTTVIIQDNDKIPIGFDPTSYIYNEDAGFAELTIKKFSNPASLTDNITVIFSTLDGTAEAGSDYTVVSDLSVTFLPEEDTKIVRVRIMDDTELENVEDFLGNLRISAESANISEVTVPQATVSIMDNDERIEVGFSPIDYFVPEGGTAMLTVVLNMPYNERITVNLQTSPDLATDPDDYSGVTTTLTFEPNVTTVVVNVSTLDDTISEASENFTAMLSSANPSNVVFITQPQAVVYIMDNDAVTVSFDKPSYTVDESDDFATVCFRTSSGHSDRSITVTVQPQQLDRDNPQCTDYPTALSDSDFSSDTESQIFEASPMGDLLCVNISLIGDSTYEGNEQFIVVFANVPDAPNRVGLGAINQTCVTIRDNDAPIFNFRFPNITIPEPNGSANVCITMRGSNERPIDVTAMTRPKSTAPNQATAGSDYSSTTFMLRFLAPDVIDEFVELCHQVPILDDNLGNEPLEAFSVYFTNFSPPGSGMLGSNQETCVFIIDDDVPKISWIDSNVTIPEGSDRELCFTSDIGTAQPYNVSVGVRGKGSNPASADSDYTITSGTPDFTFNVSMDGDVMCLTLDASNDALDEPTEQLELYFENLPSSLANIGDPPTACVNINDTDKPVVQWEEPQVSINESSIVQVCFTRNIGSSQPYQIEVGVRGKGAKPATLDVDYSVLTSLMFPITLTTPLRHCIGLRGLQDTLSEGMEQFELYFINLPSSSADVGNPATTCVNIVDDDVVEVNVERENITVPENQTEVEICLSLSTGITQEVIITAVTGPKSGASQATANMDYQPTTMMLTFSQSPIDQRVCGRVPIIDDNLANEGDELFSVTIANVSDPSVQIGSSRESCVTIIDDDVPVIEWEDPVVNITEGNNRQICFTSDIGSARPYDVLVGVQQKGTNPAARGVDYRIDSSTTVTIPASNMGDRFCLDVSTIQDNIAENTEQFELNFGNLPSNYAVAGIKDTVCVNIDDDEAPEVTVDIPEISVPENETEVEICISLSTGISEQVNVTAETGAKSGSANQASAGEDYTTTTFMLRFEPSTDGRKLCGKVPIINDLLANEGTEQFAVRITRVSDSRISIGQNSETCVNIIDDDVPEVKWGETSVDIPEGGNRLVCFSSNIGTDQAYNVMVGARQKGASPATRGVDYSLPAASLSVSFSSMSGEEFCINVTTIDDTTGEGTEQFELYFENLPSALARDGEPKVLCVNIIDNDDPVIGVERPNITVPENQTEVEVCFSLSTGITQQVNFTAVTGPKSGASQATANMDYQPTTMMLAFLPSQTDQRVCGRVPITNDNLANEGDELFSVTIIDVSDPRVKIGPSQESCVTIIDDDVPVIEWEDPVVNITEGNNRQICFTSDIGSARPYDILVGVQPKGTNPATGGVDYRIDSSTTVTIPASNMGDRFCLDVSTIQDNIAENTEQFELNFSNLPSSFARAGMKNTVCVNIDDDEAPEVTVDIPEISVPENETEVEICISLSTGISEQVNVTAETRAKSGSANQASAGEDYTTTTFMLRFEPSTDGRKLCGKVPIINDLLANEGTEQFAVRITRVSDSRISIGQNSEACVNIVDDDVPEVKWGETSVDIPEGGNRLVCFSSNIGTDQAYNVMVGARQKGASPATRGVDYSLPAASLSVSFSSMSGEEFCINVTTIDDTTGEGTEQFELYFENLPSALARDGEPKVLCVNIIDNDDPVIGVERPNITVPENQTEVEVCITLSTGVTEAVLVTAVTGPKSGAADQATAGTDYSTTTLMLVFTPSSDGQKVCGKVPIMDDSVVERNEQFSVTITSVNSSSVMIGPNRESCITIIDDDALTVSFERDTYRVNEGDGSAQVCVLTNIGHTDALNVVVTPVMKAGAQNPALVDSDFDASSLSVTFLANATGNRLCVDIPIIDDFLDEYDEQFLVRFGNIPNAQAGVGRFPEACVTIIDDDVPIFTIDPPQKNVTEPEGRVKICISTNSSLEREVVVTAMTGPKSGAANQATATKDYEPTVIMVTFRPSDVGSTLCGFVPIINDTVGNEPNEEFSVTLVSASPDGEFGASESCITIIDDDVVGIEFATMDVVVNENDGVVMVCLVKNVTTEGQLVVVLDAEEERGVTNPASNITDFESGFGRVIFEANDTMACGMVRIKNDNNPEAPEVFMVTFRAANLVIPRPPDRQNPIAEVTIIDDDAPPSEFMMCQINQFLQVKPFERTSEYRFNGICEFTALSSCQTIPGFDVRVTVDFLTQSMENGAVGLHVNNLRYVSREDGSFDDGGQTPVSSSNTSREYAATSPTRVLVSFGDGMTNITFDSNTTASDPLNTDIQIIHTYGGVNPSFQINIRTANNSAVTNFCGLCGSRSGSLLRRDGIEANVSDMAEVQQFAQSYLVEPRDQILRSQSRECGIVRNDTVIGDPLYAAPVYSEDGKEYSLCYEVFGRANATLNLVSDTCVNVNARYGPMDNPQDGNIIRSVGVRAKGMSANSCHNIRVDLEGCSATVETPSGDSQSLASMERFEQDGISVRKYPSRVRISAPNCENVMLVMWVVCERRNNQDMIRFVIARGVNLRPSSHGLLGQFWNIPVTFTKYNGTELPAGTDLSRVYVVTVEPLSPAPARSFLGHLYHLKWDKTREPCVYVGNAQGGASYEVLDPNDSVIQGRYRDYILQGDDIFATNYMYSEFEENRCS